MFKKIREQIEEKKRHDKEVARLVARAKKLDSQQPDNYALLFYQSHTNQIQEKSDMPHVNV